MRALVGANRIHLAFLVVITDAILTSILYQSWPSIVSAQVVFGVQLVFQAGFLWLSLLVVWDTFLIKNGLIKILFLKFKWVFVIWLVRLVLLAASGASRLSYISMPDFWDNAFLQFIIALEYFASIGLYAALLRMGVAAGKCSMQHPSFWKN